MICDNYLIKDFSERLSHNYFSEDEASYRASGGG